MNEVKTIAYVTAGMIRAFIPFLILTSISIVLYYGSGPVHEVRSTFIVGIISALVAGFSVIYSIDGWSLKKQSIIHFGFMLLTIFPCLIFSGWFEIKPLMDIAALLGIFLIWGITLWSIFYLIFGILIKR
ncbi:DUF3021 family protein [Bacillus sp. E214]|uniref:DUF3021 family protein n=1 Tax=Bacillus sp. E214 TaxID=2587156 RepID=UPI001CA32CFE|nr:DUF3021 family protein [Bacillus sp. E214]